MTNLITSHEQECITNYFLAATAKINETRFRLQGLGLVIYCPSPNRIHLVAPAAWFISFLTRMELQVDIKGCNFLWNHRVSGAPLGRTDDEVPVMTSLCNYLINLIGGWDANM